MIFSDADRNWQLGPWTSNAKFLYCRTEGNHVVQLIACGASFLKLGGSWIFKEDRRFERVEWLEQESRARVSSSGDRVDSFSEKALEAGASLL
jgi:hypothetical protein